MSQQWGKELRDMWHDRLSVQRHPRPQTGVGDHFQRWGCSCASFPRGTGYNWGVWQSRRTPPLSHQISPHGLAPLRFLTQAGPPSAFVTHCSQLYCTRAHFTWPRWDIWSSSGCHLFLREGDRSPNWDPWYAHLSAALVAAHHVMWQPKLSTHYYLKFPIKDVQKECRIVKW